ncbi:MAG: hypothetical protein IJ193_09245 [Bacilli bacterium]|nr:hypothetical protein [Bacilli bacterium]
MKNKSTKIVKIFISVVLLLFLLVFLGYSYKIHKTGSPIIEDHDFIKEPIYFPWPNDESFYLIKDYEEYERLMRKSDIAKEEDFKDNNVLVVKSDYRYCENHGKEVITNYVLEENKITIDVSYEKPCNVKNCTFKGKVAGYYYMVIPKSVKTVLISYKEVDNEEC